MKYYHGSNITGLKELIPNFKVTNTIKEPVIYFTKDKKIALFYIWNRPYKYASFYINSEGKIEYLEEFPNQLFEFYNGNSGSIYECEEDINVIFESHIKGVFISLATVQIKNMSYISNVYEEILKEESLGNIIIKRYETLSIEEKNVIRNGKVRSIHMLGLLNPNENNQKYMATFMKDKFPKEWEIAVNNTEEEIKEMINKWRISIGLNPLK